MPRRMPTAAAIALLLLGCAPLVRADDVPQGDKTLDGEWEMTEAIKDGKTPPRPPESVKPLYAIQDGVMTPLHAKQRYDQLAAAEARR